MSSTHARCILSGAACWCLSLALAASASAQTTSTSTGQTNPPATATSSTPGSSASSDQVIKLNPFKVVGFRASLDSSVATKRFAPQEIDAITSEQVGQFGEQDVGEALQRIAGVTLTRNNGEGQFVSIRGMSPQFTRLTIDGRTAFMTVDQSEPGRSVLLSPFSANLFSKIEVVKSPTAADVEGGLGGTVRLITPDPLDVGRLHWGLTADVMDAEMRDRLEPNYTAFYSNVFFQKRLGILLSATYDDRDRRLDTITTGEGPDWALSGSSDPTLANGRYPQRYNLEQRTGTNPKFNLDGKLQFQATPHLQLYANTYITREQRHENKADVQINFNKGKFVSGTIDPNTDTLTSAQFTGYQSQYPDFRRDTKVKSTGVTAGFKWTPGLWKVKAEASYYDSSEYFDDVRIRGQINKDGQGGYVMGPNWQSSLLDVPSLSLPLSSIPLNQLRDNRRLISIGENDVKLDATRSIRQGFFSALQLGVRLSQTKFQRQQSAFNSPDTKKLTMADGVSPWIVDGTFGQGFGGSNLLKVWPAINPVPLFYAHAPADMTGWNNPDYYWVHENESAAYAMVDFSHKLGGVYAKGNLGVRFVKTKYDGVGRVTLSSSVYLPDGSVAIDNAPALATTYNEPLPAFNFTIQPHYNSKLLVRGAITRGMTQPTVAQISPVRDISVDNLTVSAGNVDLKPFTAWQYDLGVEYYFGAKNSGMVSLTGFTKAVQNFIVPHNTQETLSFPAYGVPSDTYNVSTYTNAGKASIKGVEFDFQTPFTFLPGLLSNFGTAVNFTYTDSKFTNEFGYTYSFPGTSKITYNAILYYEQGGFSVRFAYNYLDDYLRTPSTSPDGSNTIYGQGGGRLDFSLRYRFKNGFKLSFDAQNLTRQNIYRYWDIPQRLQTFQFDGRIFTFGVGYDY